MFSLSAQIARFQLKAFMTQKHHSKEVVRWRIMHNDIMNPGMRVHLPVSVAEGEIMRYEAIPTAILHPNKDEIEYLRRLVIHMVNFSL
ncbi:hypothetical protein ACP70R_015716 [Stipagrostis hirtigluma subsp. patula]